MAWRGPKRENPRSGPARHRPVDEPKLQRRHEDALALVLPLARKKGLDIRVEAGEPIRLTCDAEKVHQIFSNLLSNAIKFTEQGSIVLSARRENGRAEISVRDTGMGVSPAFLTAIFDRFFQSPDAAALRAKGTGLGLAIAKGWTEAHGGKIWAASDGIGKGTTFHVELPLEPAAESAKES